ncbi:Alpha/Beta hydrolase protein [Entophlyctis helioformis]|nr:Alpha/Beta hydrolase protein [Entophlyctis helioformis]
MLSPLLPLLLLQAWLQVLWAQAAHARAHALAHARARSGQAPPPTPVVFWHGMGDWYGNPDGIGNLTAIVQDVVPGVFVHSVRLSDAEDADKKASFFGLVDEQIPTAQPSLPCPALPCTSAPCRAAGGFNAVGISQGGLFLRAYHQRCTAGPPIRTLISFGSPHAGVADAPNCADPADSSCAFVRSVIRSGVYWPWIQRRIVQAQYFKQWDRFDTYLEQSAFLADVNNEREAKNAEYKTRMRALGQLVLVRFENDTMVVPRDTAWFSYFDTKGTLKTLKEQPTYTQDWIGLRSLDEAGRIEFVTLPGNHVQIPRSVFRTEFVEKYLKTDTAARGLAPESKAMPAVAIASADRPVLVTDNNNSDGNAEMLYETYL